MKKKVVIRKGYICFYLPEWGLEEINFLKLAGKKFGLPSIENEIFFLQLKEEYLGLEVKICQKLLDEIQMLVNMAEEIRKGGNSLNFLQSQG